jgi:hypothetical protein
MHDRSARPRAALPPLILYEPGSREPVPRDNTLRARVGYRGGRQGGVTCRWPVLPPPLLRSVKCGSSMQTPLEPTGWIARMNCSRHCLGQAKSSESEATMRCSQKNSRSRRLASGRQQPVQIRTPGHDLRLRLNLPLVLERRRARAQHLAHRVPRDVKRKRCPGATFAAAV